MNIFSSRGQGDWFDVAEPTDSELLAIEAEWPSIAAELVLLDDELAKRFGDVQDAPVVNGPVLVKAVA